MKVWDTICAKINTTNQTDYRRTIGEIRKKWTPYISNTKKEVHLNHREVHKTSSGPPSEEITSLQDKVVVIIG